MSEARPLFILDTSILLHIIRQDALARWVEATYSLRAAGDNPLVSIVSEGEIRSLARQFSWGSRRLARMEELLAQARIISVDFPDVVETYALIDPHCRREGTPVGENDTWIAATARATGARLLATDRDFALLDPTFLRHDWIDPAAHR